MTIKLDPGNITIEWDSKARAAYISVSKNKVARTIEASAGITVDLDSRGRMVGIEWIAPAGAKAPGANFKEKIKALARTYHVPEIKTAAKVLSPLVAA